ncbi:phosphoglucomutase PgcA [Thermoclostridium stercorarium subsp. stercorarium DSM 8532]|uniref:Phosphoglucomutase PgcA n=2 Tax=Thermoclostridium stercorarium TaxID=1510 RepID=L7VPT0_THES1|nr:phospho-sugar mutase [Thermoclostridium stercorarium]AGC68451.1 phosphoglucomutase PgcA [Thermoclostridium stercorarium subsp. stercorarium DSM 8532]AGI39470.1 phosphoglucomutase [Thermoclostridium stercorarium subsp. stercorarium DSM 8532]ANW98818.1 phosphoglucomutase [Thermoclostridium stercorarium subsp. thermolacticum DSM 2910]
MSYIERYNNWVNSPYFDEETKAELLSISDNEKEIEERFYRDLEFGTGGLRGIIGAGTNRMNRYVVRRASQGLANFLLKVSRYPSVVIAYDSRFKSREFAEESARVFAKNGIKTFLFDELRPTPELSFAVRYLKCDAGVVITASHNPKEYNGYKVYGKDGGQIPPDIANAVLEEINAITDITSVEVMDFNEAVKKGLIEIIGKDVDDAYIGVLKSLSVNRLPSEILDKCSIIYTPLHGSGNKPVRRILKETGFNNVYVVPEQENPDPNFSTVKYPNPEEKSAFELAIKMAKEKDVELIIGTDPDCDRVGIVVRDKKGEYITLTGNQTGCLLMEYILAGLTEQGRMPEKPFAVKTIVSTELARKIASAYNVKLYEVLTGFKFIGEQILLRDENGDENFVFGFEESYGYLTGTFVRDKDAVVASMLIAEMFAWYKSKGLTLYDALINLYEKYGYAKETLDSFTLTGKEGLEKIQNAMSVLRSEKTVRFGDTVIKAIRDYKTGIRTDIKTGKEETLTLPKSNVLYYETEEDFWFCIRPSGTEPKIKIYYGVSGNTDDASEKALKRLREDVLSKIKPLLE